MPHDSPRVTYVVSQWGAPTQTFVRREAAELAAAGIMVEVLSIRRPVTGDAPGPVRHQGAVALLGGVSRALVKAPRRVASVIVTVIRFSAFRNLARQLAAALHGVAWAGRVRDEPDLLHAHFGWVAGTAAWAASTVTDVPYSVVLHAFEIHTRDRVDRFTAVPIEAAARVFTISEYDAELVTSRWDCKPEVLRMGVPASWISSTPPDPDDREPRSVVSVGSLLPKKGHDILIRATRHLGSDWTLQIVGEGGEQASLEQLIDDLDLADRVHIVGALPVEEVRRRVGSARVFALACTVAPSGDRDGIPVALMEAMAVGTPVVTTELGGIPELVEGAGELVPQRDAEALARAIESLADDEPWCRCALAGRSRVRERFTTDVTVRPLTAFIEAF